MTEANRLTGEQLKEHRIKRLKQKIILLAHRETVNKPKMSYFTIHNVQHLDEIMSYERAECILKDEYTHPITKQRVTESYYCIYDGNELKMEQRS